MHFFSKLPVRLPDDLRKLKLFTSASDPEAETLYREFGMKVVPISITDMLPSLQTNLIQAFDVPPLFALLDRSFGLARNMIDVKWAALSGATLVSRKLWETIPGERRAELLKASRGAAARWRSEAGRSIQRQHGGIKGPLMCSVEAGYCDPDGAVDVACGLGDALAAIPGFLPVSKLHCFLLARGGSGGRRGTAHAAIRQKNLRLDCGVSSGVENFASDHFHDFSHECASVQVQPNCRQRRRGSEPTLTKLVKEHWGDN